jgi:hypothetical protein
MRNRLAVPTLLALTLLLAALCPAAARAQQAPAALGSRVRVWIRADPGTGRGGAPITGTLSLWDGGVLVVTTASEESIQIPVGQVARLQRSEGRRPRGRAALRGAGMGLLIGGGVGAILGLASGDVPPGWFAFTAEDKAILLGVTLGTVGTVAGAVAGANRPGERWGPSVEVPGRVSVQAGRSGVGVAVSLRF